MRESLLKSSVFDESGRPDEKEIIRLAQHGDVKAFERLVHHYQQRVLSLAFRMVGDPDGAKDVAQDVFIRLYRFLPQFKPGRNFFTWLYRIVVNVSYDFLKNRGRYRGIPLDEVAQSTPALISQENPVGELDKIMEQLLETLSSPQKTVFILREAEGLSGKEIAGILECPEGTVRSHLHHARKQLKYLFEKMYPEFLEGIRT
jgi:RNA polymerase sigma-70 factor (ECF subfamily)